MRCTRRTFTTGLASCVIVTGHARAERPIRIVLPYPAGGVGDATARLIADDMQANLQRPVIVENKVGAAGRLGVLAVKDSPADGSILLFAPIAPMAVFPHVYGSLGYDPDADFAPIAQIATFDIAVAIGSELRTESLQDLIAWLRANPSRAFYGSPATGSLPHFFAVLFAAAAGLELRHVAYRGNAQALADLIGGHLPMFFTSTQDLVEAHKASRIRVLATSGTRRSSVLPEVPTFAESGYAIRGEGWYGLYAPASTPRAVVGRLNEIVVATLRRPEIRSRLGALGLEPTGTSPAELAAIQRTDRDFWGGVIRRSGFKPE